MTKKKVLNIIFIILFWGLILFHIILLILGRAWIFTTLSFYAGLLLLLFLSYKRFRRKKPQGKALKIIYVLLVTVFVFFVADIILRVSGKFSSYSEKNYSLFYVSPYNDNFSLLRRKIFYGEKNPLPFIASPGKEYKFKTTEFEFIHKYNSLGLREKEFTDELLTGREIILCIGDSFTEGVGAEYENSWPQVLERKLRDREEYDFVVINAGISGSDPIKYVYAYNYLNNYINPDYIIISIGSNDLLDIIFKGGIERYEKDNFYQWNVPKGHYLYSWNFVFRAICNLIYDYPEIYCNEKEFRVKLSFACGEIIRAIHKISTEFLDKKIVLFIYPDQQEAKTLKYRYEEMNLIKQEFINDETFIVVDQISFYKKHPDKKQLIPKIYHNIDGHCNSKGYNLWGEYLFDIFDEQLGKNKI